MSAEEEIRRLATSRSRRRDMEGEQECETIEEARTQVTPPVIVRTKKQMGTIKLGGPKFEVTKYDGRTDYLLWERQVKGILRATGLGNLLKDQPMDTDDDDW